MRLSKWVYYLSSIPTILLGMKGLPRVVAAFLGLNRGPFVLHLRSGERFKVRSAMDIWIIKESVLDRDYEAHSTAIQDGWTVLDIGAGLGDFAVSVARRNPRSAVYACEPFPESAALLAENIGLNDAGNVHALPYAVGAASGPMRLEVTSGVAVMHSTAELPDALKPRAAADAVIDVRGVTLGELLDELKLAQVDFLKIDCEGCEYAVLLNADAAALNRVRHICLEYHNGWTEYTDDDLAAFFRERGWRVRRFPNPSRAEIGLLHAENPLLA